MNPGPGELFIGLMSGTSADAIDAAAVRMQRLKGRLRPQLLAHVHKPFSPALRRRILHAGVAGSVTELCRLNFELGEHFARATLALLAQAKLRPKDITAIGSHGQTVCHLPGGSVPSTLQLAEPAVIAARTGIRVVADFRVADIAAGGQGAPLVPLADWVLFSDPHRPRLIQNIGGIANLTFLPAGADLMQVLAFDTGPGNMVIDGVVSRLTAGRRAFDHGGRWALQGKISAKLLAWAMKHPFFLRSPPRTTGREEFGQEFQERFLRATRKLGVRGADIVATATALTARTIADAYRNFIFPHINAHDSVRLQLVLGGGGAKNLALRQMLQAELPAVELLTHEDFGIANQAKEALAFAVLAYRTLRGEPGNVPSATGASRAVILGKIVPAT